MTYEILTNAELPKTKGRPNRIKSNELNRKIQKRTNFKNWYVKNRDAKIAYLKQWKKNNPENSEKSKIRARKHQLKMKYGMTIEQYEKMLSSQNGHCIFCDRTPEQERYGVLSVDHCHKTNRIRGLLCMTHNRALGVLGDNEEGLLKALAYVRGE